MKAQTLAMTSSFVQDFGTGFSYLIMLETHDNNVKQASVILISSGINVIDQVIKCRYSTFYTTAIMKKVNAKC